MPPRGLMHGSFTNAASVSAFPLSVASGGRYLQTPAGTPFRVHIDAGWPVLAHASDADATSYLQGIAAKGFTGTILMNIVHAGGTDFPNVNEPNDFYGTAPFATAGWFDTANDTYFNRVSGYIDQAKALGIVVVFFHTYTGAANNDGYWSELADAHNTNTVCFNWGVYLATKFTQSNVIWMHGGDHFLSSTQLTRYQQIVAGIQSVTRNRLSGSEWDGPDSLITDQTGFTYGTNPATSDMQLNSFYGGGPSANGHSFDTADRAWTAGTALPGGLEEPAYENAWYAPAIAARHQVRATHHWSVTAGAIGWTNLGADNRWNWIVGASPLSTITATGGATADAALAFALYKSLSWWLLVPSGTSGASPHGVEHSGAGSASYCGRVLVVSGQGSGDSTITSCIASDGSQLLAYAPPSGTTATTTFSIDCRSLSAGTKTAQWWNPTTGVRTNASPSTVTNALSAQSFTTPGDNGTSRNDWMLVIS